MSDFIERPEWAQLPLNPQLQDPVSKEPEPTNRETSRPPEVSTPASKAREKLMK